MALIKYVGTADFGPYEGDPEQKAAEIAAVVDRERRRRSRWAGICPPDFYTETFRFDSGRDEFMLDTLKVLVVSRSVSRVMVVATRTEDAPYLEVWYPRPVGCDVQWIDD